MIQQKGGGPQGRVGGGGQVFPSIATDEKTQKIA